MPGLGTVINALGILLGALIGLIGGKYIKKQWQEALVTVCGVCVIFIGITGALEGYMTVSGDTLSSSRAVFVIACMTLGTLVGEIVGIEAWFEALAEWLKKKTGNAKDPKFVNAFMSSSLTFCIGAMSVVGPMEDALNGDVTTLVTKTVIDFVCVIMMTCSLGIGCIFSALSVFVFQGLMTLLAFAVKPFMTPLATGNLSFVGSVIIFCIGVNLLFDKKIRVANMIPALAFAVGFAFLPFSF